MMRIALVASLFVAAACAARQPGAEPVASAPLRLCVQNAAAAQGRVVAQAGLVRFDVLPDQEVCKAVTVTGVELALHARTAGDGLTRPRSFSERLRPGETRCWRWRVTSNAGSSADLLPCGGGDDGEATGATR